MSMGNEIDNTLTNNISQHSRVDPHGRIGVAEPSITHGWWVGVPSVASLKWQVKMSCSQEN